MPKLKRLKTKIIFRSKRLRVRESTYADGQHEQVYDFLVNQHSVVIVALTDNNEVVLMDEYRVPVGKVNVELPGGGMDHDRPLQAAKRELYEETGITAGHWHRVASINPLAGNSSEIKHIYLARQLELTHEHPQHEEDISKLRTVPFATVIEDIRNGRLTDGQSITALCMAGLYLNLLQPSP